VADLVRDPEFQVVGMMFERHGFDAPVYFFNHVRADCQTTFTLPIAEFSGFISEEVPAQSLAGTKQCGGQCSKLADLNVCDAKCSNAPYRRFLVDVLLPHRGGPGERAAPSGRRTLPLASK
jgi:hypothetical protein